MFEIAICDDDAAFVAAFQDQLAGILDERGADFHIALYAHPDELLRSLQSGNRCDLIFQDVLFDAERGIRFAKQLREMKWDIDLVFVTSSPDYAVEGYEAFPLHYLMKPVRREALEAAVDRFLEKNTPQRLRITTARGTLHLRLADILYFEIYSHEIMIHLAGGGRENCVGTLKDVAASLPPHSFVRPHRSYLVNLEHVSEIVRYRMRLTSGDTVPISKNLYKQTQRSLIDYADRKTAAF